MLSQYQLDREAIQRLYLRGFLTKNERGRAESRLVKRQARLIAEEERRERIAADWQFGVGA